MLRLQSSPPWIPVPVSSPSPKLFCSRVLTLPNVSRKPSWSGSFRVACSSSSSSRKRLEGYDSWDAVHRLPTFKGSLSQLTSLPSRLTRVLKQKGIGETCSMMLKGNTVPPLAVLSGFLAAALIFTLRFRWYLTRLGLTSILGILIAKLQLCGELIGQFMIVFWSGPNMFNLIFVGIMVDFLSDVLGEL